MHSQSIMEENVMVTTTHRKIYDVKVISKSHLGEDIAFIELLGANCPLPEYEPGSHIDLYVQNDLIRQYSLIKSTKAQASYKIAFKIKKKQNSATKILNDLLQVGAQAQISLPRNAFPLVKLAPEIILICGGIGITPMIHMAMTLADEDRRWSMHVASRKGDEIPLLGGLENREEINKYISSRGERLLIQDIVERAAPGAHFYCCGPGGMVQEFLAATQQRDPAKVHYEQFDVSQVSGNEFAVILARSGKRHIVRQHETILDVLRNAGHQIAASCRQGICGACETRVISGVPEHKDRLLTDSEKATGQTMLICCSRGLSAELTLDL